MEKLKEIINEVLENSSLEKITELDDKIMLINDLGMDSLMLAELTVRIEMEYGTDIFEDGVVRTIGEIIETLKGTKNV